MARAATLAVLAFALGVADGARAQSMSDQLPPEPATGPERAALPPEPVAAPGPVATAAGGPSFVLRGVTLEGATAVPPSELAPIWAGMVGQPVTLAMLEDIAARVGAAFRARGFVLSQALLPAQTIADGQVRVLVVEGFVDRLAYDGGTDGQQAYAARVFAPVAAERPLRLRTLERGVLLARDTFGGTVETVVEPSPTTFAAADLTVLIDPDPFTGFASVDNRGSRLYGAWTINGGGSLYNRLGLNERLDGLVAVAPQDLSLAYGQVGIDVPLPVLSGTLLDGGRLEVTGDLSHADPDLTESGQPEGLTTTIDETNVNAGLFVPFVRTRSQNLFGRAGLTWRESESETGFDDFSGSTTDRLVILYLRTTWDLADRFGGVTLVDAALRQGLDAAGARIGEQSPAAGEPDFTLATLTLSRLQRLGGSPWALYGEAIGQFAASVLPNSERFSLGNASIGRGFAPGNTSGDSGYGARLELRRQVGSGLRGAVQAAELYAFGDYGQAYDRKLERDLDQWEEIASVGIGARVDVRPWLTLTPEIAHQLAGTASDTTDPDHETRVFLGAIARF